MTTSSLPFVLLLTSSTDGSSDVIVRLLSEQHVEFFRWNSDLWRHYDTSFDGSSFRLTDPTGRSLVIPDPNVVLLWRKPFLGLMDFEGLPLLQADITHARNNTSQFLLSLVSYLSSSRQMRLIEPFADRRIPKLLQLLHARSFFKVPASLFSIESSDTFTRDVVVKPLGDPTIDENKILYTVKVDGNLLFRPFPWFLQECLVGGTDVTCVYIHGDIFFYECAFKRSRTSIDWRTEINTNNQSPWSVFHHPSTGVWGHNVQAYMKLLGLHYGRLDFIYRDGTLYFLECNPNGQFGWLDTPELELHRLFVKATLSVTSSIT